MPVVLSNERGLDLLQTPEVDIVKPGDVEQTQQVPDVGRMLQHHLHAVLFELADQLADSATAELRHQVRGPRRCLKVEGRRVEESKVKEQEIATEDTESTEAEDG